VLSPGGTHTPLHSARCMLATSDPPPTRTCPPDTPCTTTSRPRCTSRPRIAPLSAWSILPHTRTPQRTRPSTLPTSDPELPRTGPQDTVRCMTPKSDRVSTRTDPHRTCYRTLLPTDCTCLRHTSRLWRWWTQTRTRTPLHSARCMLLTSDPPPTHMCPPDTPCTTPHRHH
jgi:hypothetical protein